MRRSGGERSLVVAGLNGGERGGGGGAERMRRGRGSGWGPCRGLGGEGAAEEAELGLAEEGGAHGGERGAGRRIEKTASDARYGGGRRWVRLVIRVLIF